jgi:polyphosphate glucokinase
MDAAADATADATDAVARRPARRTSSRRPRTNRGPAAARFAVGIDFGGSGIKAALVDLTSGALVTERYRLKTPKPAAPGPCIEVMRELVASIDRERPLEPGTPIGLGLPAVVLEGVTATAVNIDDRWLGYDAEASVSEGLGRPVSVLNDADAAGVGEMRFGAGVGRSGTVVVITLGTGVGSALFRDGQLLPNTELGHIEVRGKDAEERASADSRVRRDLSWNEYAESLDEYLHTLDKLIWSDLMIIGGGISKDADRFIGRLTVRPPVVAAALRNNAGIVGAAVVAAERARRPSASGPGAQVP